MNAYFKNTDESIEDLDGRVLFFSMKRFISDICEGDFCFMCGAAPQDKEFNNEHVIPQWVMKKTNISKNFITLPNRTKIRYDQYIVPCCKECNSYLGKNIEEDIRNAVDGGLESINSYIEKNGTWKIFLWLSLIFFKTHLKDSYLRMHRDKRMGDEKISTDYDWSLLHHIHCMIRAHQNDVSIQEDCFGTILILPAQEAKHMGNFDYQDVYGANTILMRINDIAFVAVLDDSNASNVFFSNRKERLTGPLSSIQLRDVLSHLSLLNYKLKQRPIYNTKIDAKTGRVILTVDLPESMELEKHTKEEFGEILYDIITDYVENISSIDPKFTKENIIKGYQYLFDENGGFMTDTMDISEIIDK